MPTIRLVDLEDTACIFMRLAEAKQSLLDAWAGDGEHQDLPVDEASSIETDIMNMNEYALILSEIVQQVIDARTLGQPVTIDYT